MRRLDPFDQSVFFRMRIPATTLAQAQREARRQGASLSGVMRQLMLAWLETSERDATAASVTAKPARRGERRASA